MASFQPLRAFAEHAKERKEIVDEILEARRQDVILLNAKIESRAEKLDDKMDSLRNDMHHGFDEIKNLLLRR